MPFRVVSGCVIAFACVLTMVTPAECRRLESADYFKLRAVTDVHVSPDGARVAYVVQRNDSPGRPAGQLWLMTLADYAELATAFWDAYTPAGDLEVGCRAARAFAESHRAEILHPLFFGYANPTFTPGDVCPASGT